MQFEPMLPGNKRELLKHMPIGSYLKFIFTFDKVILFFSGVYRVNLMHPLN